MVNGVVALSILLVLAAVALSVRPPTPPSVAELAPQAQQQIKDAQREQSSRFGSGPGGDTSGEGVATTTTTTTSKATATGAPAPQINRGRVRRCVGDPPRQTDDPQSPPCVAYFDGDNGGATSKGVTANEVRIAYPQISGAVDRELNALVTHFNQRYEFYGRKLVLDPFMPTGGNNAPSNPAQMRADAVTADSKEVFASLQYPERAGTEFNYYDELARRGVVSVAARPTDVTERHLEQMQPYEWSFLATSDKIERNLGEYICAHLAERPSKYAGPTEQKPARVFGLITEQTAGSTTENTILKERLASCGATLKVHDVFSDTDNAAQAAQTYMLDMKTQGVTTVIMFTGASFLMMRSATSEGYFPEWIITTLHNQDYVGSAKLYPSEQASHVFGLSFWNKFLPGADMPWRQAIKDGDPGSSTDAYLLDNELYLNLLLLASGIQTAGPKLTPQTFQAGLYRTKFPNPNAGGPPYSQAQVGFGSMNHSMVQDATVIWWDPSATSASDGQGGAYCYFEGGRRFGPGGWQRQDPAYFTGSCT